MKKTLTALAIAMAVFGAQAQTANSGAQSGSNSGADSTSGAAITSSNSGNTSAIGNLNASQSNSDSRSGAASGSSSGAVGNNVVFNTPSSQTINSNSTGTSTNNTNLSGQTTSNENVKYSGVVENRASGGTYNVTSDNVHYSGTQTIKNVPGIAMSGPASGPCTGNSGGLGLAGPGWGVGLNGSAVMVDCRLRENLRVIGMAMQSLDGGANPQEKGEATVMFMDAFRGLAAYNNQLLAAEVKQAK